MNAENRGQNPGKSNRRAFLKGTSLAVAAAAGAASTSKMSAQAHKLLARLRG